MDYSGTHLTSIDSTFGGSSILQTIDGDGHTTGMTFDNGVGGPGKLIFGPGDPFKSPLIWQRNTELDTHCPWLDLDTTPIIPSPPGTNLPGMGAGFIVNPAFGSATNFPMMPLGGKRASIAVAVIRSKMANVFPVGQSFDHFNINIYGQTFPLSRDTITFGLPTTLSNFVPFAIIDDSGNTDAYGGFPSIPQGWLDPTVVVDPLNPSRYYVPVGGQAGKPIVIFGPFSGDSGQTRVVFNGDPVAVYSESGWYITFQLPLDIAGTTNVHIDDGLFHYKGPFSTIGLKLISDDRILKPGERDAFRVRVTGLEDIKKPVEVNIVDLEQGIVAMDGGSEQSFTIQPGSGDKVTRDYGLTAIQKGAADIVAWVPLVWSDVSIDGGTHTADSTGGTTETTGGTVTTTGTTVSTGETLGGTTGVTTDTTGGTTGSTTTGGTTTGSTEGSSTGSTTGQTTGNTTGDTTGDTTGKSTGETRPVGIATAGWFEPCQGVWQDDKNFPDKPTKQLTKLSDTSYKAELKMVLGRHTKLYGLRDDKHTMIVIKGETNRSIEVDVRFRFTLTENGKPPRVLYIEPAPHNKAYVDGPVDKSIHKFNATLNAYDGIGLTNLNNSWQFTATGPYTIVADLIKPDGSSTGLSVSVFGDVVKTLPPKVYFYPMIWNEPNGNMHDALADLKKTTKRLSDACADNIPIYYPLADKDFHTEALDAIDYTDEIKRIDGKWSIWDASFTDDWRVVNVLPRLARKLSTMAYQEKTGRIVCVLPRPDFKAIKGMEDAAASTETQKVIFVPDTTSYSTIAHEYVHTTPFLWSSDEMEKELELDYHNGKDKNYADGAEIFDGSFEKRENDKPAIMGPNGLDKWITQGTYWHLINEFLNPHDPPVTVVTGYLKNDHGVDASISPLYQMMGEVDLPEGPGNWEIELRGADGSIQHRYGFEPHWQLPDVTNPVSYLAFAYRVPYLPGTAQIDIAGPDGKILDSRKISKHGPQVSITSPVDRGAAAVHNGKVTVKWTGKDPDGTPLLYSVLYSPNDGDDWYSEAFEISGTTADIVLEGGAEKPRVKVIATNGSRSSESEAGFTLDAVK